MGTLMAKECQGGTCRAWGDRDSPGNLQGCIIIVETKATTSEGTGKSWMEFGYHVRQCSRIVGPAKMLQVTFAVEVCHPTAEELSAYRPHRNRGPGIVCCIDCVRGKAILLLTISLSLIIPDDRTWLK